MNHRDNIFLSERLMNSAEMVTKGHSVADVGCDHAHTSIWLVKNGIAPMAIAMDLRKGPLSHADANIRLYGLSDRITTRLSDGLDSLEEGETDSIIITGMGGTLTVLILEKGIKKAAAAKEIILQPQSDIGMVRRFLRENGFSIIRERMCTEEGKFYNSIKAKYTGKSSNTASFMEEQVFDEFGELLIKEKNPVLSEYLGILKEKNKRIIRDISSNGSGDSKKKAAYFLHEKEMIERAQSFF